MQHCLALAIVLLIGAPTCHSFVKQKGDVKQNSLSLSGLDCRKPTHVQSGLVKSLCKGKTGTDAPAKEDILILQKSNTYVLDAIRCEKKISRMTMVCGSFSHTKMSTAMDILLSVPISGRDCKNAATRGVYAKEDGGSIQIELNRVHNYKFVEHGKMTHSTNNVACQGATIMIHGEQRSSIVTLVTAQVVFRTVRLEVDLDKHKVIDLDMHTELHYSCRDERICQDVDSTYYIKENTHKCKLHLIRQLTVERVKVETDEGVGTALVNHKHKVFFMVKKDEPAGTGCEPLYTVSGTNYPEIKIVTKENTKNALSAMGEHLPATMVDLDIELRISEEYLSYHFESMIKRQMTAVGQKLCSVSRHGLNTIEVSPFHESSLIKVVGDLVQELKCTPVTLQVNLGESRSDKCFHALPAWLQSEPVWVSSVNHLIVATSEVDAIECSSAYVPLFQTDDGQIVHANPKVEVVDVEITHLNDGYLHLLEDSPIIHQEYGQDLVYTSDEIARFNSLIHFESTKARVVDALTAKYCSSGKCGSYQPNSGTSTFDLSNLEDTMEAKINIVDHVLDAMKEYGAYASILVLLYLVLLTVVRLFTVLHLKCTKKVPVSTALRYTFYLNTQIRDALMNPDPTRGRPVDRHADRVESRSNSQGRASNRALPNTPRIQEYVEMDGSAASPGTALIQYSQPTVQNVQHGRDPRADTWN